MTKINQEGAALGIPVATKIPPEPNRRYMNPLNKIRWRRAVMARHKRVTLEDGRVFVLDYDKRPGTAHFYPLRVAKGVNISVPRGYLSIEAVEKEDGEWIVS